mmetsp:Transcript_63564/g.113107  ORF Transcript_63564/g.113107 Transcript_63564/m.113107 type:complete len:192 (-) Transcript_63564:34-609(-)
MGKGGDYCSSLGEYAQLLKTTRIDCAMFKCTPGWIETFQAWNLVFGCGTILVTLVYLIIALVQYILQHRSGIVDFVVSSCITMVVQFFVAHTGWFCVVKQGGCCGTVGYLAWGIVYLLVFLGRYAPHLISSDVLEHLFFYGPASEIVYTILLIPVAYMCLSCFMLVVGAAPRTRAVELQSEEDSDSSESEA